MAYRYKRLTSFHSEKKKKKMLASLFMWIIYPLFINLEEKFSSSLSNITDCWDSVSTLCKNIRFQRRKLTP